MHQSQSVSNINRVALGPCIGVELVKLSVSYISYLYSVSFIALSGDFKLPSMTYFGITDA